MSDQTIKSEVPSIEELASLKELYIAAQLRVNALGLRLKAYYEPFVDTYLKYGKYSQARRCLMDMPMGADKTLLFRKIIVTEESS